MPSSNSNNSNNFQHQNQNQNIVDQTISTLINAVNSLRSNTALPSAQPPPPPPPAPPSVNTYLRNSFPTVAGGKKNRKRVRVLQSPNSYFIQTAKCRGDIFNQIIRLPSQFLFETDLLFPGLFTLYFAWFTLTFYNENLKITLKCDQALGILPAQLSSLPAEKLDSPNWDLTYFSKARLR